MRIEYIDKSVRVLTLLSLLCKLISFSVVLFISSFKNIFSVLRAWHSCSSDWTCLPQVSVLHGGVAGSSSWRTGWTSLPGSSGVDSFKGSVVGVWSAGGSLLLSWGQSVDALVKTQKQQIKSICIHFFCQSLSVFCSIYQLSLVSKFYLYSTFTS